MIGNSLKSDVLPVLAIGGYAVHIPFHTTWAHEKIDHKVDHKNFQAFEKITEVLSEHKSVQPDIFKRKIVFFFFRILRYMELYLKAEHLSELNALDNRLIESQWYSELKKRSAELIKNIIAFREIADSQETDPLDESRRYIEEHYQDEISLEQIAALYHFNASYFSTLFKQRFGISFSEYLSDIRIGHI